jgi:hypothetical protein
LKKDREAVGGAKEEHGVYLRDVHAFVEKIHGKNKGDLSLREPGAHPLPAKGRCPRMESLRGKTGPVEDLGHSVGMVDAHAEPQPPGAAGIREIP